LYFSQDLHNTALAVLPLQGTSALACADRFAGSQHAARNPCSTLLAVLARWNVAAREMAQCKRAIMICSAVLFHWHDASQIVLSSSACFARTILRKSYQLFHAQERVGIEEATAKI